MNALSTRISRVLAAGVALLVCVIAGASGAGLGAVLIRTAAAFGITWLVSDLLVRGAMRALLRRVLRDQPVHRIDVTLR